MFNRKWFLRVREEGLKEFGSHIATVSAPFEKGKPWHVLFKRPGTSIYFMDLIILRTNLYVSGDLGAAVYRWSESVTPQFLLGCDCDYFLGKCEASEYGRKPVEWDGQAAEAWLDAQWEEFAAEHAEDLAAQAVARELFEELRGVSHSEGEWRMRLAQFYDDPDDPVTAVFGSDGYSESGIFDAGEVPAARCILHWQGMRLAFSQLGFGEARP